MKTTLKDFIIHSKSFLGLGNNKNALIKAHDIEFAAFFCIRNVNLQINKDLAKVLHNLKGLESLNTQSRSIFESCCSINERLLWYNILNRIDNNLKQISEQFNYLKGSSTSNKINLNGYLFWEFAQSTTHSITEDFGKLNKIAFFILPQMEKMSFKSSISQEQEVTLTATVSYINMCKKQFDFITQYAPKYIADESMQNMINRIPTNYTLEEAQKYESENREVELSKQNNLKPKHWYSFFNLSSKNTHNSSSGDMILDK